MYRQKEQDEDMKFLRKFIPDATPEKLRTFQNCMSTDAVYKSAIPYGLAGAAAAHMLIPKKVGAVKPVVTVIVGLTTYMFGKVMYVPVCSRRAFGVTNLVTDSTGDRRNRFPYTSDSVDNSDRQDHRSKYFPASDSTTEEQSAWNSLDANSESSANAFDDTSNHWQEESTNEQRSNEKRRVTYDDLWVQHREQEIKDEYRKLMGGAPSNRSKPVAQQRYRDAEEDVASEAEVGEKDIWI